MTRIKRQRTAGKLILQIALALFFIASGIITLQLDSGFFGRLEAGLRNNEVAYAINSLIRNTNVADILIIAFGVIEFLVGIFLAIQLFVDVGVRFTQVLMAIIVIVWLLVIILVDIMGRSGIMGGHIFDDMGSMLSYFKQLSAHLLVLGSVIVVQD